MKIAGIVIGIIANVVGLLGAVMSYAAHSSQRAVTAGEKVGVGLSKGFAWFFAFVFSLGTMVMAVATLVMAIKLLTGPKKGVGAFALVLATIAGYLGIKIFLDLTN